MCPEERFNEPKATSFRYPDAADSKGILSFRMPWTEANVLKNTKRKYVYDLLLRALVRDGLRKPAGEGPQNDSK